MADSGDLQLSPDVGNKLAFCEWQFSATHHDRPPPAMSGLSCRQ